MLNRFLKDCRGGVAPMMGLLILPLMGAVGMAVDYSRANAARAAFQVSLDSTALMLSKTAATDSAASLEIAATNYLKALFVHPDVSNIAVTAT
jgi:Flp pilus assembly protein TadG